MGPTQLMRRTNEQLEAWFCLTVHSSLSFPPSPAANVGSVTEGGQNASGPESGPEGVGAAPARPFLRLALPKLLTLLPEGPRAGVSWGRAETIGFLEALFVVGSHSRCSSWEGGGRRLRVPAESVSVGATSPLRPCQDFKVQGSCSTLLGPCPWPTVYRADCPLQRLPLRLSGHLETPGSNLWGDSHILVP